MLKTLKNTQSTPPPGKTTRLSHSILICCQNLELIEAACCCLQCCYIEQDWSK